jgi:hypothetical protein
MALGTKVPTPQLDNTDKAPFAATEWQAGTYVIKCPNDAYPKIPENTKATINHIRKKRKKDNLDHKKKKILATANFTDFDS